MSVYVVCFFIIFSSVFNLTNQAEDGKQAEPKPNKISSTEDSGTETLNLKERYEFNVKRAIVFNHYVDNWTSLTDRDDNGDIKSFKKPTNVDDKIILSSRFGRWISIQLNLLFRVCSLHYEMFPDPNRPKRSIGCAYAANYMGWYHRILVSSDINPASTKSDTFDHNELTKAMYLISRDSAILNNIFTTGLHQHEIFEMLQYINPQDLREEDTYPVQAHGENEDEIRKDYYNVISSRLWRFIGSKQQNVDNYFNKLFGGPLCHKLTDLIPSFEFYEAFLKANDFIDRGIKFENNFTNYEVIFATESYLFSILPDGKRIQLKENDLSAEWQLKEDVTLHSDLAFQYTESTNN